MRHAALAMAALMLPALASAEVMVDQPLAVMPFKNLNKKAELEWLAAGMAETMISDLKATRKVQVVERQQLDQALAELALTGVTGSETSTAARVGKMVGAKTVVVGGYQQAGTTLRITARFVQVETGLVTDTAKVTGPVHDVFRLQDQIVRRLISDPLPPRFRRDVDPKAVARKVKSERARKETARKQPTKKETFQAYRLYAMSLSVASDAQRVGYLKQAVELDPDFRYALEDLEELEKRMVGYRQTHDREVDARAKEIRKLLDEGGGDAQQRSQRAFQLLTGHLSSFRYRQLLEDARFIYEMDWPRPNESGMWVNPKEYAAFSQVQALQMLKEHDLALQTGEKYLQEFPGGTYFTAVESLMSSIIGERRRQEDGKESYEQELVEIETDRQEAIERARSRGRELPAQQLVGLDLRRCSAGGSHHQYEDAVDECGAFIDRHGRNKEPSVVELVNLARWLRAQAYANLGRFGAARREAGWLLEHQPEYARQMSVRTVTQYWPR